MTTLRHRTRSACLGAILSMTSAALAEDGAMHAPEMPSVEIDRSAIVIDVASQRRALDASIRHELSRRELATESRARKLAATGERPRG